MTLEGNMSTELPATSLLRAADAHRMVESRTQAGEIVLRTPS